MKSNTRVGTVKTKTIRGGIFGIVRLAAVSQVVAICSCLLGLVARGYSDPIWFTFTGTGSGSASTASFTDSQFTIRLFADTADVVQVPDPNNTIFSLVGFSTSIDIAGIGAGFFLTGTRVFVNQASNAVGFSLSPSDMPHEGSDLLDIHHPAFATYDLRTSFGPVAVTDSDPNALGQFQGIASSLGPLSFTAATDITFTAVVVPEPSTIGLFAVGVAAFFVSRRCRRRWV